MSLDEYGICHEQGRRNGGGRVGLCPQKLRIFGRWVGTFKKWVGTVFCPENENRELSDSFLIADMTRDSQWISDSAS